MRALLAGGPTVGIAGGIFMTFGDGSAGDALALALWVAILAAIWFWAGRGSG